MATHRKIKLKELMRLNIAPFFITTLVRLWFGTVRVEVLNKTVYEKYFRGEDTGNVVAGSWHRNAYFLFYFFRNLGSRGVMVSKSKDGDFTAKIAERLGYTPIRGSSSKGGSEALAEMISFFNEGSGKKLCGTPVDGPRGPACKLKKGMLAVAKETGACFIPMACSGTNVITFRKSWDKAIIPKPFSKMVVDFDEPIYIPKTVTEDELENIRRHTETVINRLTEKVDRVCGYIAP